MALNIDDVRALRHRLEADRKKIEEREKALAVLEEMIADGTVKHDNDGSAAARAKLPETRRTLREKIMDVLPEFGDGEFTASMVAAILERRGDMPSGTSARSRVSVELNKAREDGAIVLVKEGGGNIPHTFTIAGNGAEGAAVGEAHDPFALD